MTSLLDMLEQGDVCSLGLLIAILWLVGSKMAESSESVRRWGWRLGACAFAAYGIYSAAVLQPADSQAWLGAAFRGLLAAGLAVAVSWIVLSIITFIVSYPLTLARTRARAVEAARQRRQHEEQHPLRDNIQWQQAQREEEQHSRQLEQSILQAEAQRRRTDTRACAALTFSLFASKLQHRFTQQTCDDFVAKYMGDDHPPEDVERRFEELLQTLQKHLAEVEPPEENRTLADLAQWFVEQKTRIESLPVDEKVKRVHLTALNARYAELSARLLERLHP